MGVYKRPNSPYWWIKYFAAGERIQESTGTRAKQEAIQQLARRRDELAKGIWRHPRNRGLRFDSLLTKYLASPAWASLSPKTQRFYTQRIVPLRSYFGAMQVLDMRREDVEEFREIRLRSGASPTTVHHELTTLFTILRWAAGRLIPHLPFQTGRLKPTRAEFLTRVLSPDEELRILAACTYQRPMIIAALDAGMIKKEIFGQRWTDVDFGRNLITMSESKKGRQGRIVPLTVRFKALLRTMPRESEFVFTYKGKRILTDTKKSWYRILNRANVDPIRFQDLRATYNTRLEEIGVPPAVSMALMGHRRQSVRDRYTRPTLPMLRDAISKLDGWLREQGLHNSYIRRVGNN